MHHTQKKAPTLIDQSYMNFVCHVKFFHLSLNEKDLLRSILKSIGTCFEEKKKKRHRNLNETFKSLAIVLKKRVKV